MNDLMMVFNLIIFLLLTVLFAVLPFIGRKNLSFGVSVPPSEFSDVRLAAVRKKFLYSVIIVGVVLAAVSSFANTLLTEELYAILFTALIFAYIIAVGVVFFISHKAVKAIKAAKKWSGLSTSASVVDTGFNSRKITCSPAWFIFYGVIIIATAISTLFFYDVMPDQIAMQFSNLGEVTRYVDKTVFTALSPVFFQIGLSALFGFIFYTFTKAKVTIDPENTQQSIKQNVKFRYRWSTFIVATGILMLAIFAATEFMMIGFLDPAVFLYITLAGVVVLVIYSIILMVTTGQSGSRVGSSPKSSSFKDDDSYWKMGLFYYNKDDPAVFVEKRFGVGLTINIASTKGRLAILGIIGFIVVMLVVSL